MDWIKHNKLLTAGLFVGVLVLVKIAKGSSAPVETYGGPSIVGAPGPVISSAPGAETTAIQGATAGGSSALDIAAFITGEVEKARQSAKTAQQASATTTNVDLVSTFLTKVGANKLAGQQIDIGYNETGQVTKFSLVKALTPQTDLQKASDQAKIDNISRQNILTALKQGFNQSPAGGFTDVFTGTKNIADKLTIYQKTTAAQKATGGKLAL